MRIAALLFFLCALPIHAQNLPKELPDTPKAKVQIFNKKFFIAGISLLAASKAADVITTRQMLDRGGLEYNPVFGQHPSPVRQASINAAFFVGESTLFYFTERNRHAWIRWTGRAYIGLVIANHAQLAACSANAPRFQQYSGQHCTSLLPFL